MSLRYNNYSIKEEQSMFHAHRGLRKIPLPAIVVADFPPCMKIQFFARGESGVRILAIE